jgi:hypothetical protein
MRFKQPNTLPSLVGPTNKSLVELVDEQLDQVTGGSALVLNLGNSNRFAGVQSAYSARGFVNSEGKAAFNIHIHLPEGNYKAKL